jgi:hypothetical protein
VRYMRFDDDGKTVVHTWDARSDRKHSCFLDPCILQVDPLPPPPPAPPAPPTLEEGELLEI